MRKNIVVAAIAILLLSLAAGRTHAQQAGSAAPAPARGAVQAPPPPELLFRMTLKKTMPTPEPLVAELFTSPNFDLQYYGDAKNSLLANTPGGGSQYYDPHTFNGGCEKPCGLTIRDKSNYFDLRGDARIRWTTLVSGFHRVRPLIKLPDGTMLIGDQADGSVVDWHQSEISISEVRWLKLDPARGVTVGLWVENPDLSKVDEAGYFDVIPGSGRGNGGWVALAAFEVWGKPVKR